MTQHSEKIEKLGEAISNLLYLKKNGHGHFHTTYGSKTAEGLGRTVLRLVEESNILKD